jgi:DNA processing protein
MRPEAWRFPARNRIIAALADAVVVVESRRTGGSLHTVDEALRRDRPVLAVPGHPSSPAATGTNGLLYDGAALARDADDVLLALGIDRPREPKGGPPDRAASLSSAERGLLDALGTTPACLAELVAATGRPVDEVAHALAVLEGRGRIRRTGGWYEADPVARSAR